MRKKALWLLALSSILVLGGNAVAVTITVDGNPTDWLGGGSFAGNPAGQWTYIQNTVTVPGNVSTDAAFIPGFTAEDVGSGYAAFFIEDGRGDNVGPGYGGQNFDMEAMYYWYATDGSADGLYTGVFTGFDSGGEYSSGWYYAGDLFYDIGNDGVWDFAVETTGATAGHVYAAAGAGSWWSVVTVPAYSSSNPYEINYANAVDVSAAYGGGSALVYANYGATNGGIGDHNFIEAYVSELLLQWGQQQAIPYWTGLSTSGDTAIVAHWTMSCGNDVADVTGKVPAVPEPATMVMIGCVGLGMFVARKVRPKKS